MINSFFNNFLTSAVCFSHADSKSSHTRVNTDTHTQATADWWDDPGPPGAWKRSKRQFQVPADEALVASGLSPGSCVHPFFLKGTWGHSKTCFTLRIEGFSVHFVICLCHAEISPPLTPWLSSLWFVALNTVFSVRLPSLPEHQIHTSFCLNISEHLNYIANFNIYKQTLCFQPPLSTWFFPSLPHLNKYQYSPNCSIRSPGTTLDFCFLSHPIF